MTQPPHQPPPPQHQPPPYPYPPYYQPKPRHPQAVTVLVLGCVATGGGFLTAGLAFVVGPVAWVMGARTKREMAAEPDRWDGEDLVNVGYLLGIVGTALLALGLLFTVAMIAVFAGLVSGAL